MASSRLPGKVLATLAGRPLLEFVVRRLQSAVKYSETIVATTASAVDDAIEDHCRRWDVPCFRGSEADVLARYVAASADLADTDVLVRATADNPLYCPWRTAAIVAEHCRSNADYTCINGLSYVVPEVMRVGALRAMALLASDAYCREHVTPYFRRTPCDFHVVELPADWNGLRPDVRLTIDTAEELARMDRICQVLATDTVLFALEDAYSLVGGSVATSP